jgi:hypothetical protein
MTTDNLCFYLQDRLIQTSQTGGQRYSDTSPFSIPWFIRLHTNNVLYQNGPAYFDEWPLTMEQNVLKM